MSAAHHESAQGSTDAESAAQRLNREVGETLDRVMAAAAELGQSELADQVRRASKEFEQREVRAIVVGDFKVGKSSLVNSLVNADVCPVDDDSATAVPTVVFHDPEASATWLQMRPDGEYDADVVDRAELHRRMLECSRNWDGLGEGLPVEGIARFGLDRRVLSGGLVLIDTPGVGGISASAGTAAVVAAHQVEMVLFVTDASQELTAVEMDFLREVDALAPITATVLTKIDFYPAWRRILALDDSHREQNGVNHPVFAVSNRLRGHALRDRNDQLMEESGFGPLLGFLLDMETRFSLEAAATAGHIAVDVLQRLIDSVAIRRELLVDEAATAEAIRKLESAAAKYEELRGARSQWQQALIDGMADISADIDFDLRECIRTVSRECEDAISDSDPEKIWDQFEPWLYRRMNFEINRIRTDLSARAEELVRTVERLFAREDARLKELVHIQPTSASLASTTVIGDKHESGMETSRALLWARGAQSGALLPMALIGANSMVGGTLSGVGLGLVASAAGPVGLVLGVALGRRAMREEKRRQLLGRRQKATNAVRGYLDEVSFKVGKETRDLLRATQRELRDSLRGRADELLASATTSLEAAREVAEADQSERADRLAQVDATLTRLRLLMRQSEVLSGLAAS